VVNRCWVSCDHIPCRSWPLFRAQDILLSFPHMFGLSGRGSGRSVATPLARLEDGQVNAIVRVSASIPDSRRYRINQLECAA
jgi:hypothetical protein